MNYPKSNIVKDKRYLRWVQKKPCLIKNCSSDPDTVVPHHIYEGRGRRSDKQVVPLCCDHHAENASNYSIHHIGKKKFEAMFNLDLDVEAERLWHENKGY